MNLLLIPRLGSFGAAMSSIVAELVITILYVKNSGDYGKARMLVRVGWKKLIAGIFMIIIVYLMNGLKLRPTIVVTAQIILGIETYLVCLVLLKDKWTISYSKRLLKRLNVLH